MSADDPLHDFIVIGAGIAGASVAASLAPEGSLCLIEAEAQAGYHATGRSAAMYVPGYGPKAVRMLTRASAAFFQNPPDGFSEAPLLSARDILLIATSAQEQALSDFTTEVESAKQMVPVEGAQLQSHQPLLREGYATKGLIDPTGSDIDVNALHHGFLRQMKQAGGVLKTNLAITSLTRKDGLWTAHHKAGAIRGKTIINAAGAWAETVGQMAGAEPIGLVPKRRTALIINADPSLDLKAMPMTIDVDERFYLKPEAGQILISPANEDPMAPCDAQPDEMDIAICIDRIQRAFTLDIKRFDAKWAGLRSFVHDKEPVAGFSELAEDFFWLAGQGGYGIQSSPALARLAAALVLGQPVPEDIKAAGLQPEMLHPARLRH